MKTRLALVVSVSPMLFAAAFGLVGISSTQHAPPERVDRWTPGPPEFQQTNVVQAKALELLGVPEFSQLMDKHMLAIKREVEEGARLGVRTLPSYFINGVLVSGPRGAPLPAPEFDALIANAVSKTRK